MLSLPDTYAGVDMRLFLIRHGQTPANVLGQLDTSHPGPGLTELGTRQAAVIPDTLRLDSVDAIFASTLRRTQLTARPLAADRSIEVRVSPGLHEIEAGSLEGLNDPASVHTYMQTVFAWGAGDLDARMPGPRTDTRSSPGTTPTSRPPPPTSRRPPSSATARRSGSGPRPAPSTCRPDSRARTTSRTREWWN
ncbi:histidine phosphatase family protein [Cryobacterium sp. TmT2-59]|uniref:histidine phosphatase family protein n=1 Tax=Cryobacterium sp. TmT2-59 TaxID=1259264 RepID=UPI00321FB7B3